MYLFEYLPSYFILYKLDTLNGFVECHFVFGFHGRC